MDLEILRAIVQSRSEVMEDVKDPEKFEKSLKEDELSFTDPFVMAALTRSFSNLLSYKVSPEAYQRYSVRIQIIEILRDCLRPPKELEPFRTFSHGERIVEFTSKILRMHLKNIIHSRIDEKTDILVNIARSLMCLLARNKIFKPEVEELLVKIGEVEQTEESQKLVLFAVEEKDSLELSCKTVETLYVSQCKKLIEEPLIECFVENLSDSKENIGLKNSNVIENLLKFAADSPIIYQIASSVLKELLFHSNYSPKVMNYITFFFNSISLQCEKNNKNILDLYPLKLQSCVFMLNIKPEQHSLKSRCYVLETLEKIHSTNPEETLILMSHFPNWLHLLSSQIDDFRERPNMSVDDKL